MQIDVLISSSYFSKDGDFSISLGIILRDLYKENVIRGSFLFIDSHVMTNVEFEPLFCAHLYVFIILLKKKKFKNSNKQ